MRTETIKFSKRNKIQNNYLEITLKDLISEDINNDNLEAIVAKQEELGEQEEKKLFNIFTNKKEKLPHAG